MIRDNELKITIEDDGVSMIGYNYSLFDYIKSHTEELFNRTLTDKEQEQLMKKLYLKHKIKK